MTTIANLSSTSGSLATAGTTVVSGSGTLAATAASLAQESSIVSLFGGASSVDALGLYNSLATAGASPAGSTSTPPSLDQAIVSSLDGAAPADPASTAAPPSLDQAIANSLTAATIGQQPASYISGSVSGPADVNANFASALQADPSIAYLVTADSFDQGIVSTLSAIA